MTTPCEIQGKMCSGGGRCVADGVCCTDGRFMIRVRGQSGVRYVVEGQMCG